MAIKWDYVAQELGYESVKDMLEGLYHTKKMTSTEIGHLLKIHNQTVVKKMKALGIPLRTERSAQRDPKGTRHQ